MIRSFGKKTKKAARTLALAVGLAVVGISATAYAAHVNDVVRIVEYMPDVLLIQTDGTVNNYYAMRSAGNSCRDYSRSADTLKAWLSLGQAALLSGKGVRIYYAECGGKRHITAFDLNK